MPGLISTISNDVLIIDFDETRILDQEVVDSVGGELQTLAENTEHTKIVVDMNRIELMTSTMIGQFVTFNKTCQGRNINVSFCNLTTQIQDLFKLTRLNEVLSVAANREKAIENLG